MYLFERWLISDWKPFFCLRFVTSGERQAPRAVLVNDIQQVVVDVYLVNLSLLWANDRPRLDPSEQHVDTHSIRGSRRGVGGGRVLAKKDLRLSSRLLVRKKRCFLSPRAGNTPAYTYIYTHTHALRQTHSHTHTHAHTKSAAFQSVWKHRAQKKKGTERRRTKITLFSLYSSSVSEAKCWLRSVRPEKRLACKSSDSVFLIQTSKQEGAPVAKQRLPSTEPV